MPGGKRFFGRSSCKWKDRKKNFKCILKKRVDVWAKLIWFVTETSVRLSCTWKLTFGLIKMLNITC